MNTFKLIGKIRPIKNGYEEKEFSKGVVQKRIRFMMVCGDNTQYLDAQAWVNNRKDPVLTFSKGDANKKGEKMTVAWDKRFDENIIDSVANFRKYVIDTEIYGHRKEIEESGDLDALNASKKKRHEYIAYIDFVEFLNKLVGNEKIKDWNFEVVGEFTYQYSVAKGQWYRQMVPQKIYRVADNAEPQSTGTFDIYYSTGVVDSEAEDETGKSLVNAYVQYRDNMIKANAFCPMMFVLHKDHPKTKGFKLIFGKAEEDKVYKLGVQTELVNGSTRVEVTEDMLSDEQKELLNIGMTTLDDIRKEYGYVRGEKVTEIALKGLARGYSKGAEDTVYEVSDLTVLPIKQESKEEESIDIFDDSDDDDII